MARAWMTAQADQAARDTIRATPSYRAANDDSALKIELAMSRMVFAVTAENAESLVSETLNA
jgi:hypothetical protein